MNSTTLAANASTLAIAMLRGTTESSDESGKYVGIGMFCIFAAGALGVSAYKLIERYGRCSLLQSCVQEVPYASSGGAAGMPIPNAVVEQAAGPR